MNGRILEIVTASTGPDNITSVVHNDSTQEQALKALLFALTGHDELHPATADNVVVGEVLVNDPDRIVVRHAHPRNNGGWDYEFRGTASDLEILHAAVAEFEQTIEQAQARARAEAVLEWRPSVEQLTVAKQAPQLEPIASPSL